LIEFDNVVVPPKNVVGHIGTGFSIITVNFNQERFSGIVMALRLSRICIEDAVKFVLCVCVFVWSSQIEQLCSAATSVWKASQPVASLEVRKFAVLFFFFFEKEIRHSIVRMAQRVNSLQAWLEEAAFQFGNGADEVERNHIIDDQVLI
jgi:hypothetical protein